MALWQPAPLPRGFTELWCQQFRDLSELSRLRARLRASLHGGRPEDAPDTDSSSEQLILIADELTSNALRHGGPPVATTLCRSGQEWLVTVSDSSIEVPPAPAQGRDPRLGGFGLYLIADLSVRHGWCVHRGAKTVWATVRASAPAHSPGPGSDPGPR